MARTIRPARSSSGNRNRIGEQVMNSKHGRVAVRASVVAVRAALLAMAMAPVAYAADAAPADPAVTELTQRTSLIEAGAGWVTEGSFKFGQYNGLFDEGLFGLFNLDIGSSVPYDSASAMRWRVVGTNLGLDSRTVSAEGGAAGDLPGQFRLRRVAQQLHRHVPDALSRRGHQSPHLARELAEAGRAAGERDRAAISARCRRRPDWRTPSSTACRRLRRRRSRPR